jgi:amino acid adenylation domain-containing protein
VRRYGAVAATVHELLAAQAARAPEAVAIRDGERCITQRVLAERAGRVAGALAAAGVGCETPVGVCCAPSIDQIVGVLGVLAAGGAYVPLDPEHPAERTDRVLADARPPVVVTREWIAAAAVGDVPRARAGADGAIYIIYTSGSTGVPKGVVGLNRAIVNRLAWGEAAFPWAAGEVACARTPLGFVDSVAEIFAPLAAGVPLVMIDAEARRDPTQLVARLAAAGVTRIVVVPALLATLFELYPDLGARLPALRLWFVGGEPVPVALVERFSRALPGRRLINIYGATEVSGDATYYDFAALPPGLASSPIGVPLPGATVRILDDELRETDLGEVCVAGACLARGYHGKPALTAERFVANPFPEGGRLYRMGDLGRRLPSGDVQYLGRRDQLVKIRGMRVELGEVEAHVLAQPEVAHACAVARDDGHGSRMLVAFYSGRARPAELRAQLAARLPAYLVPGQLVQLDELPRNASGKIDRRALDERPVAIPRSEPPASELERRVARAWEDVLEQRPIGRTHDFFELGGTSLTAVRVIARLRDELALAIPLAAIFEHPTLAALAAHLATVAPAARLERFAVTRAPVPAELPLSHYQYPFWLFRALTGDTSVVCDVFGFARPVDVPRLERAFAATVAAFDTLWMRYPRYRAVQQLQPRRACSLELAAVPDLAAAAAAHSVRRFELARPPHVHARLVQLPGGEQRLLVAMPHVAVDMTGMELFRARLEREYMGESPAIDGASIADLVAWEQRAPAELAADAAYWRGVTPGHAWNRIPAQLFAHRRGVRALGRCEVPAAQPVALIHAISAALCRVLACDDLTLLLMIEKRDRGPLRSLFTTLAAPMPVRVRAGMASAELQQQLIASYQHSDHMMRVPTLWNDSWRAAPRWLRRSLAARYLLAIVPPPGRRNELMICVNILPEVVEPEGVEIVRRRTIDLILRPNDLVIGADRFFDRTLQIHVTREAGQIVVNVYGGALAPPVLDAIAARTAAELRA